MTIDEFCRALVRSRWLGAGVLVACTLAGAVIGIAARPAYEATAIFQVEQLADIGGAASWNTPHSVVPRLNVDVLEKWLGQADVLGRIAALAGGFGGLTPARLHRDLLVVPAGDVGLYEVTARNESPELARRTADAAATVIAERAARFVALEQDATLTRLRRTLAQARAPVAGPVDATVSPQVRRQATLDAIRTLEQQIILLEAAWRASPPQATIVQHAALPAAPVTPSRLLYLWFGLTSGLVLAVAAVLVRDALAGGGTE